MLDQLHLNLDCPLLVSVQNYNTSVTVNGSCSCRCLPLETCEALQSLQHADGDAMRHTLLLLYEAEGKHGSISVTELQTDFNL